MFTHPKALISIVLLLAAGNAAPTCPLGPSYIYVGNDEHCNFTDIQSAIGAVSCHDTTIVVSSERNTLTYTGQHLDIDGKSMTIQGSANACPTGSIGNAVDGNVADSTPPAPAVVLHGDGSDSVIYIHDNSNVTLESLQLTGGGGTYGGGIHFSGTGTLTIADSTIIENGASYGGGIQFNGSGGNATLNLNAGTIISDNTAVVNGGGIEIQGSARLFALQPSTLILENHAPAGYGGGIAVFSPARADIGSPGYNGGAVIQFNDAKFGGGISINGNNLGDNDEAEVRVFSVDGDNPVQISSNTASSEGGGIYLLPVANSGTLSGAGFCAFDFRIEDNIAPEGSAIFSDTNSDVTYFGGIVELNGPDQCGPEPPTALGAVACAPDATCNTISHNVTEDLENNPKPGAALFLKDNGELEADRFIMRGNSGAHAIRLIDGIAFLTNCLIADNALTGERFSNENDGNTVFVIEADKIDSCTFVNNSAGADNVIRSDFALTLRNSIIDEPGLTTLDYTADPADLNVSYILSNNVDTLPVAPGVVLGEPTFVDAAGGDYHLQTASLGVDFAPAEGGLDLDRLPRDVDLIQVQNGFGPRDLGAYERQSAFNGCGAADSLFCNGFEPNQ